MTDKRITQAAIHEEGPRTAAAISLMTHHSLDTTLYHLRQLEADGQIRHKTDEAGVVRWEMVPLEQTPKGMLSLEAMVLHTNRRYDLTPAAKNALGL